jgi:DNA adenine methylase
LLTALKRTSDIAVVDGRGVKPPLKWAGGKRWLVPHLRPYWCVHSHRRLVEPFCGGLAIALGLLPKQALLNDINPHAINFFLWLKKGLVTRLETDNEERLYYRYRERFNQLITSGKAQARDAAELFYYLNRTGYNGLCRFNRSGKFNVPFGRYANINYATDFREYQQIFREWNFTSLDFERIEILDDDFVYADPPYDVEFRSYAKEGFAWDDQVRLAKWLGKLGVPVVVSNQATERVISLYQSLDFKLQFLNAPRMISCTGDRAKAREILATKGL